MRALEKNYFALFGYSWIVAGLAVAGMTTLHLAALLGPLIARPAGFAALLALALVVVPARMLAVRQGWGWPAALLAPWMGPIIPIALVNSMWSALRHGGIRWRGTVYPLKKLRRGH